MTRKVAIILAFSAFLFPGKDIQGADDRAGRDKTVFVSILPLKYFAGRIAGDKFTVEVLVGPGKSPAVYEPTPRQMTQLAQSGIFFRIGVPYENALMEKIRATMPGLRIVDTREGISLRHIKDSRDPEHGNLDPHIWLDPSLAKIISEDIYRALVGIDSGNSAYFKANLDSLVDDLEILDKRLEEILKPLQGDTLYVFHPAFGYFAAAYGMYEVAVETGGKEPGARHLADLIDRARRGGVHVIFVQPQFSTKSAERIAAAIDGVVVKIDPLAEDYIDNLEYVAKTISRYLGARNDSR